MMKCSAAASADVLARFLFKFLMGTPVFFWIRARSSVQM